jgi:hypothetical protein
MGSEEAFVPLKRVATRHLGASKAIAKLIETKFSVYFHLTEKAVIFVSNTYL